MDEFSRLLAAAGLLPGVPYTRPGYPRWMLYTAEQWENYDSWNAHCDERERKYGRLMPQAVAAMQATARKVW